MYESGHGSSIFSWPNIEVIPQGSGKTDSEAGGDILIIDHEPRGTSGSISKARNVRDHWACMELERCHRGLHRRYI